MALFSDRLGLIGTENAFKIGPYIREAELASGRRIIRCNLGEPDFPLPKHVRDEVHRQIEADKTHYCDPQGILPLREAIAKDVGDRRGLRFGPEQVVVTAGAKPPIGFSQEVYCNPGDEVIYPSPGYPVYESFTTYLGSKPVPLHLDEARGFTFDAADLAALITPKTKLVFLNFPSNPTGGVATREQIEAIAKVFLEKAPPDARMFSDEVYETILFDGAVHNSIASVPGMQKRTIIVSAVSKTYAWTGGRVGWAVFPTAEEADAFRNMNINYYSCLSEYNEWGAKVAIESPESRTAIAEMVAAFQKRRDATVKALNEIPGVSCRSPKGAFYLFPNISGVCERIGAVSAYDGLPEAVRGRTSPATLFQLFLLFRHGLATMDRRSFGRIGSEGKHYLRFSIATSLDDLKEAVVRFARAADDRAGFADYVAKGERLF